MLSRRKPLNDFRQMKKLTFTLILLFLSFYLSTTAQEWRMLALPHHDLLSSDRVLFLLEDREGVLWYATEGGGVCRDDGIHVDVFRSDNEHPDLLGSNNISSLADAGNEILVGTFHGAYRLSKADFSISRMKEVDDKRVDDILTTRDGRVFLTSNKQIYEYSHDMQLQKTHPSSWKGESVYVSHLFEDCKGRIWATQWDGGLMVLESGKFIEAKWPLPVAAADLADGSPDGSALWVGTVGKGIVRYIPSTGEATQQPAFDTGICIDLQLSSDGRHLWMTTLDRLLLFSIESDKLKELPTEQFTPEGTKVLHRLSKDSRGTLLVSGSHPGPFAIENTHNAPWYDGTIDDDGLKWVFRERQGLICRDSQSGQEETISSPGTPLLPILAKRKNGKGIWATDGRHLFLCQKNEIKDYAELSYRPSALADDGKGFLWSATGNGLCRMSLQSKTTEIMSTQAKDVSAIAFTSDGTLWMGTIYGDILTYKNGKTKKDTYASDPDGHGVTVLSSDTSDILKIVTDRYVRLYDTHRKTLRQQSREDDGVYCIELRETEPECHWPHPSRETIVERIPSWLTSWWMFVVYSIIITSIIILLIHNHHLRRQRRIFLKQMTDMHPGEKSPNDDSQKEGEQTSVKPSSIAEPHPPIQDKWLKKAIAQVEQNLGNESYNVEQLSQDMCMSRMTFYRKIQTQTGQKPTEFIRTIRLRHAAKLLQDGEMTVSEISDAIGFSSVSYFSRTFRTMFGVSPTQFGKSTTADSREPNDNPS